MWKVVVGSELVYLSANNVDVCVFLVQANDNNNRNSCVAQVRLNSYLVND
jgi:hypothetical protein